MSKEIDDYLERIKTNEASIAMYENLLTSDGLSDEEVDDLQETLIMLQKWVTEDHDAIEELQLKEVS